MATIGLKYCIAAPIVSHVKGQMPTYGTGVLVGSMMTADLTWNRSNSKQFSDDRLSDSDNSVASGTLTVGVNEIIQSAKVALGIDERLTEDGNEYSMNMSQDGYTGIAYMKVKKTEGVMSYEPMLLLQTMLGITNDNARTKGETTEFQSPTLTGDVMPIVIDSSRKNRAEIHASFDTEAEAWEWMCEKLNYTGNMPMSDEA